jgi:hypothetical protein
LLTKYIEMLTKKAPKSSKKYLCQCCDYYTSRKSQYVRHVSTEKHKNTISLTESELNLTNDKEKTSEYICKKCNKVYMSRVGLWYHQKKCINLDTNIVSNSEIISVNDMQNNSDTDNDEIFSLNPDDEEVDFKLTTKMFYDLLKQNNELQKSLIELSSKQIMGNNNIINSQNKTFNLQVFLNETCKDALNISDFIEQIQISITDLEETGRLGYAEGISKVFLKNMTDIDYNKRPVHCSDIKRETFYVKDNDEWTKDDDYKTILTNAIKRVAHKNMKKIKDWQILNPYYNDPDSKQNDKYLKIMLNSMSGSTKEESDKNHEKIIKNVAKKTAINKNKM